MRLTSRLHTRSHAGARRPVPGEGERRPGTTLVELTVVIVLLGLVVGGLLAVVQRQQRFHRGASGVAAARSQVTQAAAILPGELRGMSPTGDAIEALDSALEFHSTIATGVVCERGADWVALVPLRPPGAPALRGELVPPEPGDIARILDPDDRNPDGDRWPAIAMRDVTSDAGLCAAGPYIDPVADAGRARLRLTLDAPLPPGVAPGTPLRVTRRVRYSLYRSSDRLWYLGFDEWRDGEWSGVQPVSGPYAGYARGSSAGVRFEYLDAAGDALPEPVPVERIALVRLILRSPPSGSRGGAASPGTSADSAVVAVALRNRGGE